MNPHQLFLSAAVLLTSGFFPLSAQNPATPPKILTAAKVDAGPKIDGSLSDDCWKNIGFQDGFVTNASETEKAREQTRIKAAYDDNNLWFAVQCDQKTGTEASIETKRIPRDGAVYSENCLELFLDPANTCRIYYQMTADMDGNQFDAKYNGPVMIKEWNGRWTVKTSRPSGGWTAEFRIPFSTLFTKPAKGTSWRFNMGRNNRSLHEISMWTFTGNSFHNPARFGRLKFE
ncbi:MAG: sugar-binding protein [Verrucomicrobiae bacterium]|nr:sugar-binding protein [Verrucomicrobiae bacterium]